jgi:hypothetical protein
MLSKYLDVQPQDKSDITNAAFERVFRIAWFAEGDHGLRTDRIADKERRQK